MSRSQRYTRELLTEAAERCQSLDEVIEFIGAEPYAYLGRYLLRRFQHYGIDVAHFPRRPYRRAVQPPDTAELRGAITSSRSVSETLRRLGRPDNSWQRGALRRWAAEANISMSHFLGQAHQRGGPGTTPLRPAEEILVRTENGRRTGSHLLRRALRGIGIPEQCAECGTGTTWHGRPLTLEVDHINADWSDNRPDNLRLLCPNCHAVTRTWCRGRARARPR